MRAVNRTKKVIAAIVLGCGFVSVLALLVFNQNSKLAHGAKIPVRFTLPAQYSTALIILADRAGYFEAHGIAASLSFYPTGQDALTAMLNGDGDFAGVFETPVVHAALAGAKMEILTELHTSDEDSSIVYRKDRGISRPEDLIGRRIAVVQKTNAEFVVDLFLRSHLIDSTKVTIVPGTVPELVESLKNGAVDAAGIWEPFVSNFIEGQPQLYGRMQAAFYTEFSLLVGRAEEDSSSKDLGNRDREVVAALIEARNFLRSEPARAQLLVEEIVKSHNPIFQDSIWSKLRPRVGLSSTLVAMLNEEARWYQSQEGRGIKTRIDFRAMLRPSYLKELAPRTVTFE